MDSDLLNIILLWFFKTCWTMCRTSHIALWKTVGRPQVEAVAAASLGACRLAHSKCIIGMLSQQSTTKTASCVSTLSALCLTAFWGCFMWWKSPFSSKCKISCFYTCIEMIKYIIPFGLTSKKIIKMTFFCLLVWF